MPERPLLIFPQPTQAERRSLPPSIPKGPRRPSPAEQRERLERKFTELEQAFNRRQAELRGDPAGAEVEQVLVLQTVGRIDDFVRALKGLEGLEWMGDLDTEGIIPDEQFYWEEDAQKTLSGRLYLIMANQTGLRQLLSLWEVYRANPEHPQFVRGRTKWRDLFNLLRDIRPWGPEDRLHETGLLEVWKERVQEGVERLHVEAELWPRRNPDQRLAATRAFEQAVEAAGGRTVAQAYIQEINYHGVLVDLPIVAVEVLLALGQTRLIACDQVMFFRPAGQAIAPRPEEEPLPGPEARQDWPIPAGEPVVALLDGFPLENHQLLSGRLIVDDPDDWAGDCPTADRRHGTGMASLIIHGELDAKEEPLARPLYVRPIMKPFPGFQQTYECIPESVLPLDLIHRSVRRIKEGETKEPPVAPEVCIVNLSVCDLRHSFHGYPTPWARLLDFLAWRYQILFIVSAGNYDDDIELAVPRTELGILRADPDALERETLRAVARQARFRPLRSPADATNVLTVASIHSDQSPAAALGMRVDPIQSQGLPSPINAQGSGFRRSVKPDILCLGGRQTYIEKLGTTHDNATLRVSRAVTPPGQRVASPSTTPGELTKSVHTRGTSNATALATRSAHRCTIFWVSLDKNLVGSCSIRDSRPC